MFYDQIPDASEVRFSFGRHGQERIAENYVIYCRESDERGDSNKSIPAQEQQCIQLGQRLGLNVVATVREKRSAREANRPRFGNLIKAIKNLEALAGCSKSKRPNGIIAWHPDRLSRNWNDSAEIIELLDNDTLVDMKFVMYSFHNDSSGKEHLAMEFARAKGYSDHLQDNVIRGLIEQELRGKRTRPLHPAFDCMIKDDRTHRDHLKIIPSHWHSYWRSVFQWKLQGLSYKEIAQLLVEQGYTPTRRHRRKNVPVKVDGDYIGRHIVNPLLYGQFVTLEHSKEPRRVDLREVYPTEYGHDFPIVVTESEFRQINPQCFSDSEQPKQQSTRRSGYPLSGKVHDKRLFLAGKPSRMYPNAPKGGSGKPSPRFTCQHTKPQHSISMHSVFFAVAERLKDIRLTQREHKLMVVSYWHRYQDERQRIRQSKNEIRGLKVTNDGELQKAEETLNEMKYGAKSATEREITVQEKRVKRLQAKAKFLDQRESKLTDDGIEEYAKLDAFLELAKNGYKWWKKANDEQKTKMADLLILNVLVEAGEIASVSLAEPFASWAKDRKRPKSERGGPEGDELERILNYHRKHRFAGKIYIEVIGQFDAGYRYGLLYKQLGEANHLALAH